MKRLKRIIIAILLVLTFSVNAFAVVAVPSIIAAAALGTVLVAGAYVSYYKPSSTHYSGPKHVVTLTGALGRSLVAAHKDFTKYGEEQMKGQLVAAKILYNDLKSVVTPESTQYPALKSAIYQSSLSQVSRDAQVGQIVTSPIDGKVRPIIGKSYIFDFSNGCTNYVFYNVGTLLAGGRWQTSNANTGILYADPVPDSQCGPWTSNSYWLEKIQFTFGPETIAPVSAKSPAEFQNTLSDPLAPGVIRSEFTGDIDALIANSPGVMSIVDTATPESDLDSAPPYVPPVYVPPSVDTTTPAVTGLGSGHATNTSNVAATRAADAAAAAAAAAAARAAANADPNNPELEQIAKDAEKTAQSAKEAADAAARVAQQAQEDSETKFPNPSEDPRKSFKWDKLKDLKGVMEHVWPFTLLLMLPDLVNLLVRTPQAPSFDLHIYGTNSIHIDLSFFDPVAIVCRWTLALLLTVGIVQLLVNWYRGR